MQDAAAGIMRQVHHQRLSVSKQQEVGTCLMSSSEATPLALSLSTARMSSAASASVSCRV